MESPLKTIDYVCHTVIDELAGGDISDINFLRRSAVRCISEVLSANTAYPCIRTTVLQLNTLNQVKLPADYIRYTKVAYKMGTQLYTLTLDNKMAFNFNPPVCENVQQAAESGFGIWFAPFYNRGVYYGALYSLGGGFNDAYYRVNEEKGLIQINGKVPRGGEIVLEYLSDNSDADENFLVDKAYIPVIRWWLIWKACEKFPKKYKMLYSNPRDEFEIAKTDAAMIKGPTPDEVLDAYWAGSGFTLR
jgi:hypothetical protein